MATSHYDAILFVSFGGPEGPDDVLPFLRNVLRGRDVPETRMLEVAEHYQHFGGVSPINRQCRELIAALETELAERGPGLPVYWGNRNWHPLLSDTLRQMRDDGVRAALAFVTSAFSSYSGCRQYRENIAAAQREVGEGAPQIDKLRGYHNHPGFLEPVARRLAESLQTLPAESRDDTLVLFTAHSLPLSMAAGCQYEAQLKESCRVVAERLGVRAWRLCYQSRSGPPSQPWLGPDVNEVLHGIADQGQPPPIAICPIGFISDHMEVVYDLDTEARQVCESRGLTMVRASTVGADPQFAAMIGELIRERTAGAERRWLGTLGPNPDVCPLDCCPAPQRPASAGHGRPRA